MKRGTTTPLPPSSTTGVAPLYVDVFAIIFDLCIEMIALEEQIRSNYNKGLELQIEYRYKMMEYWEEVYLILHGKRLYETLF